MSDTLITYTFGPEERLKSHKQIGALFTEGQSFVAYPVRVVWRLVPRSDAAAPAQVAFVVPKRLFKTAVLRNRLKRLLREAYRLQKHQLYTLVPPNHTLTLLLSYVAKEELPIDACRAGVQKMVYKMGKALENL